MTSHSARMAARARLEEIQDNINRLDLPDHTWAEELVRTPDGAWTQAFAIRGGRASAITEVTWVPFTASLA